MSDDIEPTEEK